MKMNIKKYFLKMKDFTIIEITEQDYHSFKNGLTINNILVCTSKSGCEMCIRLEDIKLAYEMKE